MACDPSTQPDLSSTPTAACGETPKTAGVTCSEVFVKFGEVETTVEIEFGFFSDNIFQKPKLQVRQVGSPTHNFKFSSAGYMAGALFQVHDYFCEPADRIIGLPQIVTRKTRSYGGTIEESKFFKLQPWEYFAANDANDFDATNGRYDDFFQTIDVFHDLRNEYKREAGVVLKRLEEQKSNFKAYFNTKAIKRVDYTATMGMLYALASSGKLGIELFTNKLKIGDNAQNPGTTRKIKMVHNLFFKIVKGELASDDKTSLTDIKLEGVDFTKSGVGHDKKTCLKAVIVLNKQDGSTNNKGVYFSTYAWGKGDGSATFMNQVEESKSACDTGANGGTSGKAGCTIFSDAVPTSNRGGEQNPLTNSSSSIVTIRDEFGFVLKTVTRAEQIRILLTEQGAAKAWAVGAATPGAPVTATNIAKIYDRIWSNQNDVKPIKLATPGVQPKGGGGYEITPGLWLFLTPGPNATMGMIQGSAAQIQFLWPLETLALLGSDDLTLETLPGTLWNMFGSGIAVVQVNYVQGVKDIYASVQWYDKMQQAMARMKEMKLKIEGLQAQFIGLQQQLVAAFHKQDLAAYDAALNKMKQLATEFYNLTKHEIKLTEAYTLRNQLEAFINAQGKLQVPPESNLQPAWLQPSPPPLTPPDRNDPVPETPTPNIVAVPPASTLLPPAAQALVVPGDTVISLTPLPTDQEILTTPLDTPTVGSSNLLDVVGSSGTFDNVPGTVNYPSETFWDGSF
jgi:hypothetical protein